MTATEERTPATFEPAWPLDKLIPAPDNPRRDLGDLTELAESIAAVGIVEPLVATTTAETVETGELLVVAGHRRLAAAQKAGRASAPVMVHQQMDDRARREIMLVENIQRADLLPIEEARTYEGLIDLGYSQRELGKRIGRSQAHISRRLELLEFEKAAPSLAERVGVVALTERKGGKRDSAGITIEAAKELLKLKDHPGEIEKVVMAAGDPEEIVELVEQRKRELDGEAKIAQWKQEAAKKSWKVIDNAHGSIPSSVKKISTGAQYEYGDVLKVELAAHRKEPCHGIVVSPAQYRRGASRTEVCTSPSRHAKKGESSLKVPVEPRRAKNPSEQKDADEVRAKKEAAARREEFLTAHVAQKLARDEVVDLLAGWVLDHCGSDYSRVAAGLLGIPTEGYRSALLEQAKAADDTVRYAVAITLASGHFNARQRWHSWSSASVTSLYDHLVKHGYSLSDFEAAELEEARKKESRWQQETAEAESLEEPDEGAIGERRALALAALLIGHDEAERDSIEQLVLDMDIDELEETIVARRCRTCGCTDAMGCDEGCSWVDEDLCSSCREPGPVDDGSATFDPGQVKVVKVGKKWEVRCADCGEALSGRSTTEEYANDRKIAHLETVHGLVPAAAS